MLAATAPRDGATIVDSGSTNTSGYRIEVWSNGNATAALQSRGGTPAGAQSFSIAPPVAARFFRDLKAARNGKAMGMPCMKSASFGTSTHVSWHGWTSPDLACPPDNAPVAALVHDVGVIRQASGINPMPRRGGVLPRGPIRVEPATPTPTPSQRVLRLRSLREVGFAAAGGWCLPSNRRGTSRRRV